MVLTESWRSESGHYCPVA